MSISELMNAKSAKEKSRIAKEEISRKRFKEFEKDVLSKINEKIITGKTYLKINDFHKESFKECDWQHFRKVMEEKGYTLCYEYSNQERLYGTARPTPPRKELLISWEEAE